ncbi:MAG: aminoacyl-tRNA deacylase [Patescibacteria group bacterium]
MKDPFEEIILFLDSKEVEYKVFKHEPVITSEEAKKIKQTDSVGLKSLFFRTEKGSVLLVLSGDNKVSSAKVRAFLGVQDLRMVSPEEVLSVMGCEVGGCYPLGNICGLKTVVDEKVTRSKKVIFNAGRRDRSVEIKWSDLEKVIPFEVADISKE